MLSKCSLTSTKCRHVSFRFEWKQKPLCSTRTMLLFRTITLRTTYISRAIYPSRLVYPYHLLPDADSFLQVTSCATSKFNHGLGAGWRLLVQVQTLLARHGPFLTCQHLMAQEGRIPVRHGRLTRLPLRCLSSRAETLRAMETISGRTYLSSNVLPRLFNWD
jgi:hypothetical protein